MTVSPPYTKKLIDLIMKLKPVVTQVFTQVLCLIIWQKAAFHQNRPKWLNVQGKWSTKISLTAFTTKHKTNQSFRNSISSPLFAILTELIKQLN